MTAQFFTRAAPKGGEARTATPLLAFIAGEFADPVAHVWRPPHGEFFALPAARRHASAIALAGLAKREMLPGQLRRMVEFERDAAVAEAIAGPAAATGFMRALAKAGETLWRREDYESFLDLLAEPAANEALRHMDDIRPDAFAPLAALPPILRQAAILRVVREPAAARDMALALKLAVKLRTPDAAGRLARRWGAGGDANTVFRRVQEDLMPDSFFAPEPPPTLGAAFPRITTRKLLEATALAFRNCLVDQAGRIAEGRLAIYIWRGEPEAVIALSWDIAGWRLAEAKGVDNADLPEARLRELVDHLERLGVRSGPSITAVSNRLDDWANGTAYAHHPGPAFVDQLSLGDIWT